MIFENKYSNAFSCEQWGNNTSALPLMQIPNEEKNENENVKLIEIEDFK